MVFYGYHGVLAEETRLGQRFTVDVEMQASLREAGLTDDLNLTTNYGAVYATIEKIMTGEPVKLIETVAERIAAQIFAEYPLIAGIKVKVTKPSAPIAGALDSAAVEITRQREQWANAGR